MAAQLRTLGFITRTEIVWYKQTMRRRTAWGSWKSPRNPHIVPSREYCSSPRAHVHWSVRRQMVTLPAMSLCSSPTAFGKFLLKLVGVSRSSGAWPRRGGVAVNRHRD
jgi:hypothetical protein